MAEVYMYLERFMQVGMLKKDSTKSQHYKNSRLGSLNSVVSYF